MPPTTPNKKKSSLKLLLIILGVVVAVFVIVIIVTRTGGDDPAPSGTGLVTQNTLGTGDTVTPGAIADDTLSTSRRSDELVVLLRSVSSIELDDSIFSHPTFTRLESISSPLAIDRNPGRNNPFLPIGSDEPLPPVTLEFQEIANSDDVVIEGEDVVTGQDALDQFLNPEPVEGASETSETSTESSEELAQ